MSLLLSQASSYTESVSSKKNPRMQSTFDNIQREQYKESTTMNEGFEQHNNAQSKRENIVHNILNKTQTQTEDDSGLASFSSNNVKPNPVVPLFQVENGPTTTTKMSTPKIMDSFQNPAYQQPKGGSNYTDSYSTTPYYKGLSIHAAQPSFAPQNSQLMEKLNYMIRLLEEQQKEPTQNIMEEFVLYGLLGVFIIYLVDSFARAGKYIR